MVQPGSILIVVRQAANPNSVSPARVTQVSPLWLEGELVGGATAPENGERVALVYSDDERQAQVWADVKECKSFGNRWAASFGLNEWVELDRRRNTRYAVALAAEGLVILEPSNTPQLHNAELMIENLSETGCFASCEMQLSRGDLISISIIDPITLVPRRVVGVIARVIEPNGYGIEFFDYSGDTRQWLEAQLANAKEISERGAA